MAILSHVFGLYLNAPTSLIQGGFFFYPHPFSPSHARARKNPRREIIFSLKRSAKREAEG